MRHRLLTWQIIIKMATVLIIIALFNFSLSHLLLKDELTTFLNDEIEGKKELILQLIENDIARNGLIENSEIIQEIKQNNPDIDQIALITHDRDRNIEDITGNYKIQDENSIQEVLTSSYNGSEVSYDNKVDGVLYRTFLLPVNDREALLLVTNLQHHSALENRFIMVDISVTLFAFVIILLTLWTVAKSQLKPLGEIEQFLRRVSEGDFSKKLKIDENNQFAWLADRINEMSRKVNQLVKGVKDKADDQIMHMAFHDDLTDLPNRRKFREVVKEEIVNAKKTKSEFAILYLDLDGFKSINDTLGHAHGDRLLILITDRLKEALGKDGILSRLGGDEFTALVPLDENKLEHIDTVCNRLIKTFEECFEIHGDKIAISISIGVSFYPKDGRDHDMLLRNADAAMYQAKTLGKRQYVLYLPHMNEELLEKVEMEKKLRKAIENDELMLYYQPQVDARSGKVVGAEVLLRWYHEELGMVPPGKFIPLIEKTDLINEIGEWVIRNACMQNKKWQDAGLGKLVLSVNVSARQFQQANIVEMIESSLEEFNIEPEYLTIEVTESTAMDDIRASFEKMNALKRLGVQIAIDDFGTGHSSLRYLKSFPIDTLKIDRTFINDINRFDSGTEIVVAIIALAHSLKIGLVAEGVEEEQQLEFLLSKNCDVIQGFLFSRPLPVNELEQWLKESSYKQIIAQES